MPDHPYQDLPASAFWRTGVAEASPFHPTSLFAPSFAIPAGARIATAGSCFAQHLGRRIRAAGYDFMDMEPAPGWLPAPLHAAQGFSAFSARYGNIYTVGQLRQLAQEAAGSFAPDAFCWERDGRFFDGLRPGVATGGEDGGLDTAEEVRAHRAFHVGRVRRLFAEMDLFVFTLGLTECWRHRGSGTVFPAPPGVVAGSFAGSDIEFANPGFAATRQEFAGFLAALARIRGGRPLPQIILTVSPVPLTATASGAHVLQATTWSKSVLRAVAGELAAEHDFIDYFPAFEIVTNPAARGLFFEPNLRSVRPEGVDAVMRTFFAALPPPPAALPNAANRPSGADAAVHCDDAILEAFAPPEMASP